MPGAFSAASKFPFGRSEHGRSLRGSWILERVFHKDLAYVRLMQTICPNTLARHAGAALTAKLFAPGTTRMVFAKACGTFGARHGKGFVRRPGTIPVQF
jgi:hypothetical protein